MRVSEIRVKQIRVNQGLGVCSPNPKVSEKKGQLVRVSFRKKLLVTELVL